MQICTNTYMHTHIQMFWTKANFKKAGALVCSWRVLGLKTKLLSYSCNPFQLTTVHDILECDSYSSIPPLYLYTSTDTY